MLHRMKSEQGLGNLLARHLEWLSRVLDAVQRQNTTVCDDPTAPVEIDNSTACADCGLVPEFHDIDTAVAGGNWHLAALQYLDLVCTHPDALSSLTWNFGPQTDLAMRAFFNTAKFHWIPYSQQRRNDVVDVGGQLTSAATLRAILPSVGRMNGYEGTTELSDEDVEVLQRVIEAKNELFFMNQDSEAAWSGVQVSAGTVHPMAMMLSYAALKTHLLYSRAPQPSPDLRKRTVDELQHPSPEILDLFPRTLEIMASSSRCCPSCAAYMNHIKTKQYKEILYPIHDATWVPTRLPVYMLKETGEAMIRYAEKELNRRLGEILRRERPAAPEATEVRNVPLFRFEDYYTFDLESSDDDDRGL